MDLKGSGLSKEEKGVMMARIMALFYKGQLGPKAIKK